MDGLDTAIRLSGVGFEYQRGNAVLDIAQFEVLRGERVFLEGPSGSGKSTLAWNSAALGSPKRESFGAP